MNKKIIHTENAPAAIGAYSQAIQIGNTVYLSGQIPLEAKTMQLVSEDFNQQAHQVFKNLRAVAEAAGTDLNSLVKVNAYLTDLKNFASFNEIMALYIDAPFPARAAIGVAQLPKEALVEVEGVLVLSN